MTSKPERTSAPKTSARQYLRETQPETWRMAADIAETLGVRLEGKPWLERAYLFDAFLHDLIEETLGADGLDHLVDLAHQTLEVEAEPEAASAAGSVGDTAVQLIAAVRAILTAALYEIQSDADEQVTDIQCPEQALILLVSERADHLEPARAYAVTTGPEKLAAHLLAFPALIALLIADRALGPSIEPLTTLDRLLALYQPERAD